MNQNPQLLNLKYNSRHEAIIDHVEHYRSHGGLKSKFKDDGPDKFRIDSIRNEVPDASIVLDCGCNDGSLGYILQKKGNVVYGVDVVSELVKSAVNKGVMAKNAPVEEMPFKDEMFDVVICAETLEHTYKPEDALKEIHRVLKTGGKFIGSVPHPEGHLGIGKKADYHQTIFTVEHIKELLGKYFTDINIKGIKYFTRFCEEMNLSKEMNQWMFWTCQK